MARLNEPVTSTESIESLKRRFMRQNRDIARANSTQSLRIRNLENETSRLLAENLNLREQILRLQNELENGKAQRAAANTAALKAQLETKLLEIGALINGLGDVSRQKKSPRRGKITQASPTTSPNQRNWKDMCTLSEAVGGQEGRLPPILENKSYPRRTLEHQEIAKIISEAEVDTTDSPEIGPPPVSQFVDEDPVKIDLPSRTKSDASGEIAGINPALSANLEHRRRRKDSVGPTDSKKSGEVEQSNGSQETTTSLKTGAKRKLSVREDEEVEPITKPRANSPDDFKFTRVANDEQTKTKQQAQADKIGSRVTRDLAVARGASRGKQTPTAAVSSRKVLAPKSVNNSPRKSSKTLVSEDKKLGKPDLPKASATKENGGKDKVSGIAQVPPSSGPELDIIEVEPDLEPETPVGLDLFSPLSSQPSTAREESRDTPPPPDLGPGAEANRPSRRARGSVSYAEPNLRDKMRRPTKELIDAVAKDGRSQRTSAVKLEDETVTGTVTIKAEPEAEDAWKHMPVASSATVENSPLRSKAPASDTLPESITTHRKRRESILNQTETEPLRSSSSSAIATLLAENRRAKAAAKMKALDKENEPVTGKESLDVYECRGSSPIPPEKTDAKEEKVLARVSKRHSIASRDNGLGNVATDVEALKNLDRQRQAATGLRSSSTSNADLTKLHEPEKSLKRSVSTTGMTEPASSGTRSDRISARRRSMML